MGGDSKGKGKGGARKPRGGRGGTHPWINSQIIQASENKDVHHLMNVIIQHLPQMNLVNLSTAIHRVAKIVGTDPWQQGQLRQSSSLETLLNSVCTALNVVEATEVQPQSVSNVVWSLATLRIVHRPLLQVISLVCVSNMEQFKSFELSTTLWALAKLGSLEDAAPVDKAVFYAAATHIHNHVNDFGFRCLATTAWAFATAKQRHARLFRSMAAAMLPAAAGANCQEMANTAWAFGTADFHDDALFHELAEQAIKRLEEFKPQELSNMLWGFATNSFFHEAFYARASAVAASMDLQSQHLANILWAFARVRPKHPLTQQTVLTLLPVCTRQLSTFKPQEVSSTLLATAKAVGNMDEMTPMAPTLENFRQEVLDFFHACLPWVVARMSDFSEQSLANSVSAYAMVPVRGSETLVDCAGQEVFKRQKDLDANALVHLLKGFSLVPTTPSSMKIVKALAEGIVSQLDKVRPQEMQNMARLLNRGGNAQAEVDKEQIAVQLRQLAQNVGQINMEAMPQVHLGEVAFPQVPVPHLSNEAQAFHRERPEAQALMLTAANFPAVQPNLSNEAQSFVVTAANFPQVPSMAEVAAPMANPTLDMQGRRPGLGLRNGAMSGHHVRRHEAQMMDREKILQSGAQGFMANVAMDGAGCGGPQQAMQPQLRHDQASRTRHAAPARHGARRQEHLCPISESMSMDREKIMQPGEVLGPPVLRKDPVTGQPTAQPQLPDQVYPNMMPMTSFPGTLPGVGVDPVASMMMPAAGTLAPSLEVPGSQVGLPQMELHMAAGRPGPFFESSHKLLVKNSFLHVEDSDDDSDDVGWDGTSSHRSSSLPSRFACDREERAFKQLPASEMLELLHSLRAKKEGEHADGEGPPPLQDL